MKTVCLTILWIYCLAYMALGGKVTLTWDAQPGMNYKVWHGVTLLRTLKGNQTTIPLPDSGIQTVRVTAFNPLGYGESAPAEINLVPVVLQTSTDLTNWKAWTTRYVEQAPKMFFRLTPPEVQAP